MHLGWDLEKAALFQYESCDIKEYQGLRGQGCILEVNLYLPGA